MTFTRIFVLERKFADAWGEEQAIFFGAQALKGTPVAPGLLLYFGAQFSLGGGAKAVILGART